MSLMHELGRSKLANYVVFCLQMFFFQMHLNVCIITIYYSKKWLNIGFAYGDGICSLFEHGWCTFVNFLHSL